MAETFLIRVTDEFLARMAELASHDNGDAEVEYERGDPVEWVQRVEWVESDNPDNPPTRREYRPTEPVYEPAFTITTRQPVDEIGEYERGEIW